MCEGGPQEGSDELGQCEGQQSVQVTAARHAHPQGHGWVHVAAYVRGHDVGSLGQRQ